MRDSHHSRRAAELLSDCEWLPFRLDFARGEAIFTRAGREQVSAQPFLDPRWNRRGAPSAALPLDELRSAPPLERAPGFIWHTSFCCSTLIADCLDWPRLSLSLKEPVALVDLALAPEVGPTRPDAAMTAGLVRLLGRSFEPEALNLIKPSNAANPLMETVSQTSGPSLFLYSSLRRFLVAVAKGGEDRRFFVRTLLQDRAQSRGALFKPHEVSHLTDMQAAAVVWRLQMQEFRAAAQRLGPARAMLLNAEVFLSDPAEVLARLDGFFGIGLGPERIATIVAGPKLRRCAKSPDRPFDRAGEEKALAETARLLGADLDALHDWSAKVTRDPHPAA